MQAQGMLDTVLTFWERLRPLCHLHGLLLESIRRRGTVG